MRKILFITVLLISLGGIAFADENAFTPLNFDDSVPAATSATTNGIDVITQTDEEAIGNGNIQNAIQQLDNAQIDIRNELVNYKTKFADIDAQYKLIKSERDAAKRQVQAAERRIKEIDRAKERIRKNMI